MKASANKTCLVGPAIRPEQFFAEHLFFYLISGTMSGRYDNKHYTLEAGGYGIVRKNRLGRQDNPKGNEVVEKIIFVFDEPFLRAFQERQFISAIPFKSEESFLTLPDNELIPNFIRSLTPYYNSNGQIEQPFVDVKREELLLILLRLKPTLSGVFFDYGIPGKINLEEFMHRNYRFNVSIDRFAYLTGRSISAFKRDFYAIFNETPSRWLTRRRLEDAYFLIDKRRKKSSEIYQDLGFEALSHFSFAFKKLFGITPTELIERKNDVN